MSEEKLLVRRIKEGTVIDHIEAGKALMVLKILNIDGSSGDIVTVAMNVPSQKLKKKDIIKIEKRFLSSDETDKIALIAPRATINIIKDYSVVEKRSIKLPDYFIGVFKCPNPTCISNSDEPIKSTIIVIDKSKPLLRCKYCSRILTPDELIKP
ncbi:Aspartate carbamoyltransferase regulatory chain [archaeon HR06]|nr:Aspartate carbamoyltransferase regulatory chain [archaeon HR06]